MSHFVVYVFNNVNKNDVEDLLAPYDENIEYAPYIKYTRQQAIAAVRNEIEEYKNTIYAEYIANPEAYKQKHHINNDGDCHLQYLRDEFPKHLSWTDDECYEEKRSWFDDDMVDKDGNLLSTYNPKSKWDWYSIGGRWANGLVTNGGNSTDEDYVSEIDWEKSGTPFAFVTPNGEWHERGKMGWWACVSDEKAKGDWETEFRDTISELKNNKDIMVTLVDCHI